MLKIMIIILLFLMFIIISLKTPLTLCLSLIFLSLFSGLMIFKMTFSWMLLMINLIFLGGMMIIFMYITILANNEKFQIFNKSIMYLWFMLSGFFFLSFNPWFNFNLFSKKYEFLTSIYSNFNVELLMFVMFYLLMVLFMIVKITESFKGALILLQ